jgi:hypothetical protein
MTFSYRCSCSVLLTPSCGHTGITLAEAWLSAAHFLRSLAQLGSEAVFSMSFDGELTRIFSRFCDSAVEKDVNPKMVELKALMQEMTSKVKELEERTARFDTKIVRFEELADKKHEQVEMKFGKVQSLMDKVGQAMQEKVSFSQLEQLKTCMDSQFAGVEQALQEKSSSKSLEGAVTEARAEVAKATQMSSERLQRMETAAASLDKHLSTLEETLREKAGGPAFR